MPARGTKKAKLSEGKVLKKQIEQDEESSSDSSASEIEAKTEEASESGSGSESEDEVFDEGEESASATESESESETEKPEAKKQKHGDGFGTAMDAILGSRVKAHDSADPILIRNKRTAKEIDEAKSEAKARRALRAEKQQFKDRAHMPDVVPKDPDAAGDALQHEKVLRRTAQRGVIKLLNAIHNAQLAATTTESAGGTKQASAKQEELSKEKFLDMIRMG